MSGRCVVRTLVTAGGTASVPETFGVRTVGVEEEYMLVTPDG